MVIQVLVVLLPTEETQMECWALDFGLGGVSQHLENFCLSLCFCASQMKTDFVFPRRTHVRHEEWSAVSPFTPEKDVSVCLQLREHTQACSEKWKLEPA